MHVISDVKNYQIVISSLTLFGNVVKGLIGKILGKETEILELIFVHLISKNRPLKEIASKTLVKYCLAISLRISEEPGNIYYRDLISKIQVKLKKTIQEDQDPSLLIACLQAFGAMAKSVKMFYDENRVHECIDFLIENSEATLFTKLDRFENFDFEKNPQNFKAILFNQKQLIGYFKSLSFIIAETKDLNNKEVKFVQTIIDLATRYLTNFFPPYLKSLYESFSSFLNSFPIINYNKLIFRNFVHSILNSMDRSTIPFQFLHQSLFVKFFQNVVTTYIDIDRQTIIFDEFLNIVHNLCSHQSSKLVNCSNYLSITENKTTRDFFNICFLFCNLTFYPNTSRLIDSLSRKVLDIYLFIEEKLKSNPNNYLFLRVLNSILLLPSIAHRKNVDHSMSNSLENMTCLLEENKEKYENRFILCVYEFSFRAAKIAPTDLILNVFQKNVLIFLQSDLGSSRLLYEALDALEGILEDPVLKLKLNKSFISAVFQSFFQILAVGNNLSLDSDEESKNNEILQFICLKKEGVEKNVICNKILNLLKNCQNNPVSGNEQYSLIGVEYEYFSNFTYEISAGGVNFQLPIKNIFTSIISAVLSKQNKISLVESIKFIHFLASLMFVKLDGLANNKFIETEDASFDGLIKLSLELLKKTSKENASFNEDVLQIVYIVLKSFLSDDQNKARILSTFFDYAKKLYINDLEVSNFNNKIFLEGVGVILGDLLGNNLKNDNKESLEDVFDLLRMSHEKQNEFYQLFQSAMFLMLIKLFRPQSLTLIVLNKFLEVFFEIFQCVEIGKETNLKAIKKTSSNLLEIAKIIHELIVSRCDFELLHTSEYYQRIFKNVFEKKTFQIDIEVIRIFDFLTKIPAIVTQMNIYFLNFNEQQNDLNQFNANHSFYRSIFAKPAFVDDFLKRYLSQKMEISNVGYNSISVLHYFVSLVELGKFESLEICLNDSMTFMEIFLHLFDISVLENQAQFTQTITFIVDTFKSKTGFAKPYIEELLSDKTFSQIMSKIEQMQIGVFKKRLARIKLFFKLFGQKPNLPVKFLNQVHFFIETTLKTRDELSIDIQKCKILLKFISFFNEKISYELIVFDKEQCLFDTISHIIKKDSNPERFINYIFENLLIKKNFKHFTPLLKQLENKQLSQNESFELDLEKFADDESTENLFFDDFLEFVCLTCSSNVKFTANSFDFVAQKIIKYLQTEILNIFIFFKFCRSTMLVFPQISNFILSNFSAIKQAIFKKIPSNLNLLIPNSQEFNLFSDLLTDITIFSISSKRFEFFELIYFLFANEQAKFVCTFSDILSKIQFDENIDTAFLCFLIDFMTKFTNDINSTEFPLENDFQIFKNLIRKLTEKMSSDCSFQLLQSQFCIWASILNYNDKENSRKQEFSNKILNLKRMIVNLLEICLIKLKSKDILDIQSKTIKNQSSIDFKQTVISNNLVLMCKVLLAEIEHLLKLTYTFSKNEHKNHQNEDLNKKETFLKSFAEEVFNLLIVVSLKTQQDPLILIKTLLFEESNNESIFSFKSIFSYNQNFNFQVLTNFKQIQYNLTEYEEIETINYEKNQEEILSSNFSINVKKSLSTLSQKNYQSINQQHQTFDFSQQEHSKSVHLNDSQLNSHNYDKLFLNLTTQKEKHEFYNFNQTDLKNQTSFLQPISLTGIAIQSPKEEQTLTIEMDTVNSHTCMFRFLELFHFLKKKLNSEILSEVVTKILDDQNQNINVQVFFLKIVLNLKDFFAVNSVS